MTSKKRVRAYALLFYLFTPLFSSTASPPDQTLNYSYLYFENGYPTPLTGRRPQSEANLVARANPDLVFQTGYYSLMLDCDDMQLKGYDALGGSDYRTALDEDVTVFTPATSLLLRVYQGGIAYDCTTALVQGVGVNHVRLIESGQYLQRIDHLGLVFKDSSGNTLVSDSNCRLEMTAWPDRVTFLLDFLSETTDPVTRAIVEVVSPDGNTHLADVLGNQARLTLKPHEDVKLEPLIANDYITEATRLQNGSPLAVSFNADAHAFHIDVPADPVSYPTDNNRVDEYLIEVTNPSSVAGNIPLVFEQPIPRKITGTVMLLCEESDGRPTGIPIQISKNWHRDAANPTPHEGSWLRGSTMLRLQAGERRRLKLRVVYGYWGGSGAVSHAQLSLIGWGGNWKWEESALGAWGESITYDPTHHIGGAFLDDIRPAFTDSYSTNPVTGGPDHNWTENVGGGDFLIYRDSTNTYRWGKRLKTCFHSTGPNMTEVLYSGVTDDDRIRFTYASQAARTSDYHRRFHKYRYEFLQDVVSPQRLVFHQMAADYYMSAIYTDYSIGDETGLLIPGVIDAGGNTYKGSPIPFDGRWLSIDDTNSSQKKDGQPITAKALRGIIPLSSTLNGNPLPLYLHTYGRSWGSHTMFFDLAGSSVNDSYSAGDVAEGTVEFVMPPQHVNHYWGADAELVNRLTAYGDTAWEPVRDEFVHNLQMDVVMQHGILLRNYPLEIEPAAASLVLADFTINGGGLGHVPVLLKGAAAGLKLKAQRWTSGDWVDLETADANANTDYQGILIADGTADYAFNIPRPTVNLNDVWRVRIVTSDPSTNRVLVQWGQPGGQTDILATRIDGAAGSVGTRYYGSTVASPVDAGYYPSPSDADRTPICYGAGSLNRNVEVRDSPTGDENWIHGYVPPGDTYRGMLVWKAADFLATRDVAGFEIEVRTRNPTDQGEIRWVIERGGSWYVSAVAGTFDGSGWVAIEGDASAATWHQFTPFVDGVENIGTATAISMDGVTSAGYYWNTLNTSAANQWVGASVRYFSVKNQLTPYETWALGFGLTGSDALITSDPDDDDFDNLGEYATGGDPTNTSDSGHVPTMGFRDVGGTRVVEFTYVRRIGTESELDYHLELATDLALGDWTDSGYTELQPPDAIDANFEAVTNQIDITGRARLFIRVIMREL